MKVTSNAGRPRIQGLVECGKSHFVDIASRRMFMSHARLGSLSRCSHPTCHHCVFPCMLTSTTQTIKYQTFRLIWILYWSLSCEPARDSRIGASIHAPNAETPENSLYLLPWLVQLVQIQNSGSRNFAHSFSPYFFKFRSCQCNVELDKEHEWLILLGHRYWVTVSLQSLNVWKPLGPLSKVFWRFLLVGASWSETRLL